MDFIYEYLAPMTELLISLLLFSVFSWGTILVLRKIGMWDKPMRLLFAFVLVTHLAGALFVYYANFYAPLETQGDQPRYQGVAVRVAEDFRQGNFSLEAIAEHQNVSAISNWYPVMLAVFYALLIPSQVLGIIISVWLAIIGVFLVCGIARELGASNRAASLAGFAAALYPTYGYLGGLILKDVLVVPLVLLGTLLLVKMIKRFSWTQFLLLYMALFALIHLRFYIGFIVMYAFVFVWPFFLGFTLKKKLSYGFFAIVLIGTIPMFLGHGYFGIKSIRDYTSSEIIVLYRESAYVPINLSSIPAENPPNTPPSTPPSTPPDTPPDTPPSTPSDNPSSAPPDNLPNIPPDKPYKGPDATVVVKAELDRPLLFIRNSFVSFFYVLLGPFPWHLKLPRHMFTLVETIPWAVMFAFIVRSIVLSREKWRVMLPVLLVGFGIIFVISFLIDNFGIYMRIRMPAFLLLLTLFPLGPPLLEHLKKRTSPVMIKNSH